MPLHIAHDDPRTALPALSVARPARSRREFLRTVGVAAAALTLGRTAPRRDETWALISDTHVAEDCSLVTRGENMADNLARTVTTVAAEKHDAVLINGDAAFKHGLPGDYATFREVSGPLLNGTAPLHITLGNHDDRTHLLDSLGRGSVSLVAGKYASCVTTDAAQFVFLDSLDARLHYAGRLGRAQRTWLHERLTADADRPAVVFLHHNPDETVLGLRDGRPLREALVHDRRVKAVLFGHTHRYRYWCESGLHFINLPATGFRFDPMAVLGWMVAHWKTGGVRTEFRSIDGKPAPRDALRWLAWRSDR